MKTYSVSRNTALLTGALVGQKVLSFAYFWYLSNQLAKGQLGMYLFALSFATLFGSATDLGLTPVLIRESARDRTVGNRYLQNIISLKLVLAVVSTLLTVLVITWSGKPAEVRQLVYFSTAFVFLDAFTLSFWGMFKAARNLRYESVATIIVQCSIIAGGMVIMATSRSTLHLVGTLVIASAVNLSLAAWQLQRVLGFSLRPRWDISVLRTIGKLVPAFAFSLLFVKLYNVADVVLLGYLSGDEAVANFSIPAKVVTSLQQIIPATFAAVIFPVFTQRYAQGSIALGKIFGRACVYLVSLSVPASIALVALAPEILHRVWPAYVDVAAAFRAMALALPFVFLAFPAGYLLNATDRQRRNTLHRGLALVFSVVGNIILIPVFGYTASAWIFLLTNVLLIALDLHGIWPLVTLDRRYLVVNGVKIALASAGMLVVLVLLKRWLDLFPIVAAGGVTYVGLAVAMRLWPTALRPALKTTYAKDAADYR